MFSVINKGGSGGSEPLGTIPKPVTGIKVKKGNTKLTITWTDPEDSILPDGGEVACKWAGTKVVYKEGAYPTNRYDGIQIMDNKVRNQYQSKGYELTNLKNSTTYYFAFFPYSETGLFNNSESQRGEGTPELPPPYGYWGVRINHNSSNPESCCTYIGDAVGKKAGDLAAWRETGLFKNNKPCLLKNGVVQYYLNRDNLTLKEDGGSSNLTGADGDVMVEVPKLGYKYHFVDSNTLEVWVTDDPNAEGYCYKAHSLNGVGDCDKIYYGCYLADNNMHSYAGYTPASNISMNDFRNKAKNMNTSSVKQIGEYQQFNHYPMTLAQCLYLIQFKNLDSQTAIGRGYTGASAKHTTGTTKNQKENYGTSSGTTHMKFMNIEDFWGNLRVWVDGLYSDGSCNIKTDFNNFNDNGSGYRYTTPSGISNVGGYMKRVQGTEDGGFIIKEANGSETTYFSDYGSLFAGYVAYFGGDWDIGGNAGAFCLGVYRSPSAYSNVGSRLMFKHLAK